MKLEDLPPRIPTSTVLALAGYSRSVLWQRIQAGKMPHPIDRAKESIFLRDAVLKHLGLEDAKRLRQSRFGAALD